MGAKSVHLTNSEREKLQLQAMRLIQHSLYAEAIGKIVRGQENQENHPTSGRKNASQDRWKKKRQERLSESEKRDKWVSLVDPDERMQISLVLRTTSVERCHHEPENSSGGDRNEEAWKSRKGEEADWENIVNLEKNEKCQNEIARSVNINK
jgi:hypothetical protein